jgi:hypothetical protein
MTVVLMPEVQKELKLTSDQKKQIQTAVSSMSADPSTMTMDMNSMNAQMDAKVLGGLSPDQLARLDQIWLQYDGPKDLQDKDVAEKLNLTDDQKTKIQAIWDEYKQIYLDAIQHIRIGSSMGGVKKKRKECDAATIALLTDDQNKAFIAMEGNSFKFHAKNEF